MKRLFKKSLYKIFVSFFLVFYTLIPQSIAIGQVIDEYAQENVAPIEEEIIPEESLPQEEVALPEEEIPPVVEEPLVEEPVVEVPVVEEPVVEPEEVIKEVMSYPVWVINGDTATTSDVVELGKTYISPQNSRVRIIFTKLPESPSTISIEEITLTQEEIEATGAVSDMAYDIKTDMVDGTFEYDLVLPSIEQDTKVVYAEEREDIFTDLKEVTNTIVNDGDTLKIEDLEHFTLFIPSGGVVLSVSGSFNGVTQVTVEPGETIEVDITVERSGGNSSHPERNDWGSTSWRIDNGSWTCVNHNDHDSDNGTSNENFNITAPIIEDTYNVSFKAHRYDDCGNTGESDVFTLTDGIIVEEDAPNTPMVCNDPSDAYALNSSVGIWSSVNGGSNVIGEGTSEVKWGYSTGYGQSGLRFDSVGTQTLDENTQFLLGTLTHKNWPITNAANGATLEITLSFSKPNLLPDPSFSYYFMIDETSNSYPCAYGDGENDIPCNDKITFPSSYGDTVITIDDIQYTLVIDGFVDAYTCGSVGSIVSYFITEERKDNTAYLVGHLSSVLVERPAISITKKTNNQDISSAPGENLNIGDTVTWQYVIQNIGNVNLTNITVTDNPAVTIDCGGQTTLASGSSMNCTASGTVQSGQFTNTATVVGTPPTGGNVTDSDSSWYVGIPRNICGDGIINQASEMCDDGSQNGIACTPPYGTSGSPVSCSYCDSSCQTVTLTDGFCGDNIVNGPEECDGTTGVPSGYSCSSSCTRIRNTGTITVDKITNPSGDQTNFPFTVVSTETNTNESFNLADQSTPWSMTLPTGVYTVSEGTLPTGWRLSNTSCVSNQGSITNTFDLDNGENVTCTFTNTKDGKINVHKFLDKDANGVEDGSDSNYTYGVWMQLYEGSGCTGLKKSELLTDGNGNLTFNNIVPGNYSVKEMIPTGYLNSTSICQNVTVGAGEVKQLNFGNIKLGSINVCKYNDINGDGLVIGDQMMAGWTINLVGPNGYAESKVTDNVGCVVFDNLLYGQYTFSEVQQLGWQETIPTGGRIYSHTINYDNSLKNLKITNFQLGSITGSKFNDLNGDGVKNGSDTGIQGWTIELDKSADGSVERTIVTDVNGNYSFRDLSYGTYRVREVGQTGWTQTSFNPNDILIQSGTSVTGVDFGNRQLSSITVIKVDNLNSGQDFTFNFTPLGSASTQFVLDDDNSSDSTYSDTNTFSNLVSGFYNINEVATSGWTPSIVECTSNNNLINYPQYNHWYGTMSIALRPGENLVCTFENIRDTGTLQVLKNIDLNGDGDYTDTGETGATNWLWQIVSDINHNTGDPAITISTGTYHLTETPQTNFHVTGLSCIGGVVDGSDVTITKDANVICTFTNARDTGRVTFIKTVDQGPGQPSNWTFSVYDGNGGLLGDTYSSGNTYTIETGSYRVGESVVEGYSFDSATGICSVDPRSGLITLTVSTNGGTCTINNLRDVGSVKVDKKIDNDGNGTFEKGNSYANSNGFRWELDGGGQTFGTTINNLATTLSNYYHNFTEYMPSGYHFVSWYNTNEAGKSCTNPNGTTLPDRIQVNKDQLTSITLCNARDTGTVTIIKDAINNSGEDFYFDTNFPSGDFELEDDGNSGNGGTPATRTYTIPTGSYWMDERNESGWKLTNLLCTGDDNSVTNLSNGRVDIDLDYNENVTCTYTNTELAKVWGFKYNDENGNGDWNLGEWGLGNWRIFIDEGNGIYDGTEPSDLTSNHLLSLGYYEFDNLLPGAYSICEQLQTGWTNTTSLCRTVLLTPGDVDGSVNFGNIRYGSILVHKFEDTNGDGDIDANEAGLENWQMNVYRGYGCTGRTISEYTDNRGDAQFDNIVAGHYSVMETSQEGWVTTTPVCQNIHVNPEQTTSVNIGNVILTDIHGFKWSDFNGNGFRDCIENGGGIELARGFCEPEPLLSDWTINLFKWNGDGYESDPFRTMDTDDSEAEYGWYWFEDLLPGKYKICEVQQDDWTQTYPINEIGNCHEITLPIESDAINTVFSLNSVLGPQYDFGNTINPELEIQKSNSTGGAGMIGGDTVVFTITVLTPEITEDGGIYQVKDVKVTDIMPSGFKYQAGSWTAFSSIRGDLKASLVTLDPIYAVDNAGTWLLGDMKEGEVITLTYITKISLLQDPGLYKDLAWTSGESVLGVLIYGNSDSGIFVGTEVLVVEPEGIEEGEVLGASIELPRTGAETYLTLGAIISMILGFILLVFNPKRKIGNLIMAGVLLLGVFGFVKPTTTYASTSNINVQIEQPESPTKKSSFNIGFVALDLLDRDLSIQCYKDGDIPFDPVYNGNNGSCVVDSSIISASGTYHFYVKASAGAEWRNSDVVTVVVDLEKPLPITNYVKTEGTCTYTLTFKTANDGRTSKVEIFRSSTQPFTANASTLIHTLAVTPNSDISYTDTSITDCTKEYYYAVRALDSIGNYSTFVTDNIVKIVQGTTTTTVTVNGETGEIAGEETTAGQEGTENPDQEGDDNGEVKGDEEENAENGDGDEKDESFWDKYKYILIAAIVVGLGSAGYTYVRRKK